MGRFSAVYRNCALAAAGLAALVVGAGSPLGFVSDAYAKKIVITQTSIYISTLPKGCVKTMYGNVTVWRCGTIYYQPYKGRYVRVYIN